MVFLGGCIVRPHVGLETPLATTLTFQSAFSPASGEPSSVASASSELGEMSRGLPRARAATSRPAALICLNSPKMPPRRGWLASSVDGSSGGVDEGGGSVSATVRPR